MKTLETVTQILVVSQNVNKYGISVYVVIVTKNDMKTM